MGYLSEVPFLAQVPLPVQVDLLADTWARHRNGQQTLEICVGAGRGWGRYGRMHGQTSLERFQATTNGKDRITECFGRVVTEFHGDIGSIAANAR